MSATIDPAAGLIAAAQTLTLAIQEAGEAIDQERRLHPDLERTMVEVGVFQPWLPRSLRGQAIAHVDDAVGWCPTVGAVFSMLGASFPETATFEAFYSRSDAVVAGTVNPTGHAAAAPGEYRAAGGWSFGVGTLHSTTVLGTLPAIFRTRRRAAWSVQCGLG